MEEFKVIETQEQFDNAIKSRLEREKNKYSEQLKELDDLKTELEKANTKISDLNEKLATAKEKITQNDSEIAERDAKIKSYELHSEKMRIAQDYGFSYEAIDFLQGEDEESIRKSADSLKNLVGTKVAPLAVNEPKIVNEREAGLKELLHNLG